MAERCINGKIDSKIHSKMSVMVKPFLCTACAQNCNDGTYKELKNYTDKGDRGDDQACKLLSLFSDEVTNNVSDEQIKFELHHAGPSELKCDFYAEYHLYCP